VIQKNPICPRQNIILPPTNHHHPENTTPIIRPTPQLSSSTASDPQRNRHILFSKGPNLAPIRDKNVWRAPTTFNQIVLSTSAANRAVVLVIYFQLFREAVSERDPIPADDATPTKEPIQVKGKGNCLAVRAHRLDGRTLRAFSPSAGPE
jgi:hypothetical protein